MAACATPRASAAPRAARTAMFSITRPRETQMAFAPKKTGARKARTAKRALQGTRGVSRMVSQIG